MKPAPYGPFPYSPIIGRPRLTWPEGAQLALWVIPNIEFFSLVEKVPAGLGGPGTPVPDIPSWSARDYGNRVGVFRLMRVLDRYDIRDRKSTRLNSSHLVISYAVFCLKKKNKKTEDPHTEDQYQRVTLY